MNFNGYDQLIDIIDICQCFKKKISLFFTINVDPFSISKKPIKFKGRSNYGGYKIIDSIDEHHRRLIHWFYRNIDAPTINDWESYKYLFNFNEIPSHIIQLYNKENEPLNEFILIHYITHNYIHYTYENKQNNISTTVTIPIGIATLVPEKFLFNLKLYSNQ